MPAKKTLSFEQAMEKLEVLVSELEDVDAPLQDSIVNFEEAMKLSALCSEMLNKAERKISVLIADSQGNLKEENLETRGTDSIE